MRRGHPGVWALALLPALALAQRPDEAEMFGPPAPKPAPAEEARTPAPPAQERPPEDSMFGGGESPPGDGAPPTSSERPKPPEDNRDKEALAPGTIKDAFEPGGEVVEDPLKIGGMFSLQAQSTGFVNERFLDSRVGAPTLVDGYFDARPSDRVRGMVVGRLTFDPSQAQGGGTSAVASLFNQDGSLNQAAVQAALLGGGTPANPAVALDQAWIRFDVMRAAFITVGRQHVKWGTGRIWNPTDYLSPARRNPLAFFDARLGASMVKVHVPWEEVGANFYALGLLDNAGPATLFRQLGGALRAEAVLFKTAEVGASALFQQGRKPKYALDISTPLGPVDVYAEAALKQGSDAPLWRCVTPEGTNCRDAGVAAYETAGNYQSYQPEGWTPSVSGGLEWTFAYSENETATVGLEYFYNPTGYSDAGLYPWLLLQGSFTPFYLGKHYAALFGTLIGPGSWDKTSFLLFNLANLSDQSYVSRLNFSLQALTYLTVEAYGAVHYGRRGGEMRFGFDPRDIQVPPGTPGLCAGPVPCTVEIPGVPTPLWEAGAGLRVRL